MPPCFTSAYCSTARYISFGEPSVLPRYLAPPFAASAASFYSGILSQLITCSHQQTFTLLSPAVSHSARCRRTFMTALPRASNSAIISRVFVSMGKLVFHPSFPRGFKSAPTHAPPVVREGNPIHLHTALDRVPSSRAMGCFAAEAAPSLPRKKEAPDPLAGRPGFFYPCCEVGR